MTTTEWKTEISRIPIAGADFSPCRKYRYTLFRAWWDDGLFVNRDRLNYAMFIGLNPSTADETKNDPTIRRCIGFAARWGYNGLCMANLFAFRSTDPRNMKACENPIGHENDRWISAYGCGAGIIIAAWGVNGGFMGRDEDVLKLVDGSKLKCLRLTKGGFPEHPLYVPRNTEPQKFHNDRI